MVSCLFPLHAHAIHVSVRDGIVTLRGPVHDTSLIWVAERLVRGLEGVVGVESQLGGEAPGPVGPCPAERPPCPRA
ncbi:BON domain-containing protein [Streptomyces flaveolus]|uniref:BON domain-containing protein n=1 Tax=Streptomyces flaveolus TaxID=67297 RepID=UPI003F54052E